MIQKAEENLDAARVLLTCQHYNATANRAYYAAYHAGWHFLVNAAGQSVPSKDGKTYFRHDDILDDLEEAGMNAFANWQQDFDELQLNRVKADYFYDDIRAGVASGLVDRARRFVRWVKKNV